jgi:4-amino-4-deoxy-L-arabinose transferase-like glycosyltransferase
MSKTEGFAIDDRRRGRWALAVFAVALAALMAGAKTQGTTRDEGYYFDAAELYYGWYGELGEHLAQGRPLASFSRAAVDRWFSYNHEHPALMKTLYGLSWRLLHRCHCPSEGGRHPIGYPRRHRTLALLSGEAALRLPAHVVAAAMAALVFLFFVEAFGRGQPDTPLVVAAGLAAAAMALASPRLFFDAQLACFDAPIAALWLATVYAYHRSLTEPRWGWRTGVLFGLALATKHNAFFLPPLLLVHAAYATRASWLKGRWPKIPRAFLWMATLGPLVYLAAWPWLWFATASRFREYVAFHVHHVYYNMEYLGRNYNKPPFPLSFPYVMTALTAPVTTLALALVGAVTLARRAVVVDAPAQRAGGGRAAPPTVPGVLIGLNALFPMAILTLTRAPIFGATKHFHATLPFLALLAGVGTLRLAEALAERRGRGLALGFAALVCAPPLAETWRSHPYALTHYNLLAGGPARRL